MTTKIFLLLGLALAAGFPAPAQKSTMLMNRIGPSQAVLYVANADGTGEHTLFPTSGFDYDASFSADGKWIVFTSERNGDGQADVYRVHPDGSGLERLADNPALDDQGALSPDGAQLAFVSTRESRLHNASIWILDLKSKKLRNLTGGPDVQSTTTPGKPNAFLRPAWSPDGKWIAFSSDRNTEWKGAELGAGIGHSQELSIYLIQPDGKGLRQLTPAGITAGSPKWSSDGRSIVCYEMETAQTFPARMGDGRGATSQIVSIDIATGNKTEMTSGPGLKIAPQFLSGGDVGYLIKATPKDGPAVGLMYTTSKGAIGGVVRDPAWSPDGKLVVYERMDFKARQQNMLLYSWDPEHEYRYTDVFPTFSKDGKLAVTDLNSMMGNPTASLSVMDGDGSNRKRVFYDPTGAAMMPSWSPDGKSLVFGFGSFFPARDVKPARLIMISSDGTNIKDLTQGGPNTGFPSWSPDGKTIVYRVWGPGIRGLRLMNLEDHSVKTLTTEWDNFPFWSPSGDRIVFTRQQDLDFDVFSFRPDGTDLKQLTKSPGSDGHATWIDNNTLFFSSSRAGFKDEAARYENSPQPYAQIFFMNADGSGVRQLTDSRWEDSMAVFVPEAQKGILSPKK